jgi:TatD DNase family protein
MKLVDSHCHIDGERFSEDREQVIKNAFDAGVVAMLNVGTGSVQEDSFEKTLDLTKKYQGIYGAVGIHPHDAVEYSEVVENRLKKILNSSEKMIAWGEIGLDFYYDHSPREVQKEVFRKQIKAARKMKLPIIIHSRDANRETLEILREECSNKDFQGGIMHCFGGTSEMAIDLINIGFLISFAGNVTFKKAENLRDAAKVVPLDKLLIETDCPYLTPVPFRGKRNEPARVRETAGFLADLFGVTENKLAEQTTRNFHRFFNLNLGFQADNKQNKNKGEGY